MAKPVVRNITSAFVFFNLRFCLKMALGRNFCYCFNRYLIHNKQVVVLMALFSALLLYTAQCDFLLKANISLFYKVKLIYQARWEDNIKMDL